MIFQPGNPLNFQIKVWWSINFIQAKAITIFTKNISYPNEVPGAFVPLPDLISIHQGLRISLDSVAENPVSPDLVDQHERQ